MKTLIFMALILGALYGLTYGYAGEIYDRYRALYPAQPQELPTLDSDGKGGMVSVMPVAPLGTAPLGTAPFGGTLGGTLGLESAPSLELEHNISEIGLERTPCRGTCPAYTVIFSADGSFRYEGIMYVERIGSYTGSVDRYQFNKLAQAITHLQFNNLATSYASGLMDVDYQYVQVSQGNDIKIVESSGGDEPIEIWMIRTMVERVLSQARWDQALEQEGY